MSISEPFALSSYYTAHEIISLHSLLRSCSLHILLGSLYKSFTFVLFLLFPFPILHYYIFLSWFPFTYIFRGIFCHFFSSVWFFVDLFVFLIGCLLFLISPHQNRNVLPLYIFVFLCLLSQSDLCTSVLLPLCLHLCLIGLQFSLYCWLPWNGVTWLGYSAARHSPPWRMLNKIAAYGFIRLMVCWFLLSNLVLESDPSRVNQRARKWCRF